MFLLTDKGKVSLPRLADYLDDLLATSITVTTSGGTTPRSLPNHFADRLNVKDFGAVGDGSTNDTTAIVNAIAALPATGGTLYFPCGTYMVAPDQLVIGDGSNSAVSTINGISLVGEASDWYYTAGTKIKARSAGTILLNFAGSLDGVRIENIAFDGDDKVDHIWKMFSVKNSTFRNFTLQNFKQYGLYGTCRTGPAGGSNWSSHNVFERFLITSYTSVVDFGAGILLDGDFSDGWDWHHCSFNTGTIQLNKGTTNPTRGLDLRFCDSCTISELDVSFSGSGGGGGVAAAFIGTSNANFPHNMFFYGCSIPSTSVAGTIAKNYFVNFGTKDSETIPTDANLIGFTDQGQFFGAHTFSSALGLTDGITAPSTVAGVAQIYVDTSDGDLKVKFGDGTVKTIVVDT